MRGQDAGQRRAQLQFHERAQQVVALPTSFTQPLDAELGVVGAGFAGAKAGDRDVDFIGAQPQFLHEAARRVDFRLTHPAIRFGDVTHELEGRAEELVGNRQ